MNQEGGQLGSLRRKWLGRQSPEQRADARLNRMAAALRFPNCWGTPYTELPLWHSWVWGEAMSFENHWSGAHQPGLLILSPCTEPLRGCWTVPPSLQENQSSTWPQGKPWHARDREAGEAQATPAKMLTLLTKPQSP